MTAILPQGSEAFPGTEDKKSNIIQKMLPLLL